MLSPQQIQELSDILKADYGLTLNPAEVTAVGERFISFFEELRNVKAATFAGTDDKVTSSGKGNNP